MSEHYDFHYQPRGSGAISGQQVLQQTEDAINELGDYVNDNVGGAMDVAQQALETAQNAEQDAQTALDTANSFSGAIQSAQQDASTALSTAQTAQTTASNANNTAIQAQQDASSAVTTANNASGQVNTLSGTVTALGQRVTTAEGDIGQNTSDITALTTRVGTAEGNITTLQNDVTIAQGNASSAMATAGQVKQQAYVFRYSSTALVASSTNANSLLDNTDNLKVGDKVIDSSGVLFSITAIDTQNSTFTIGTALIDLAQDSNVVHKSGNETVSGVKTFTDSMQFKSNVAEYGVTGGNIQFYLMDKNSVGLSKISQGILDNGVSYIILQLYGKDSNNQTVTNSIKYQSAGNFNNTYLLPTDNGVWLGSTGNRWGKIYGIQYYYGSDNVEFSTKFVTTDTAQTISGQKLFDDINTISSSAEIGVSGGNKSFKVLDKNKKIIARIEGGTFSTGIAYSNWSVNNGTDAFNGVSLYQPSANLVQLRPNSSTLNVQLGASNRYFTDCYTSKVNGVEPSSLSLPDIDNRIDISSYITNLTNVNNEYTPPVNGWICIRSGNANKISVLDSVTSIGNSSISNTATYLTVMTPVVANRKVYLNVVCTSLGHAYFIPCLGNV